MFLLLASTMCAGLFCGPALYVNLVEHPARMSCGQELAVREFAPSYRRAFKRSSETSRTVGRRGLQNEICCEPT